MKKLLGSLCITLMLTGCASTQLVLIMNKDGIAEEERQRDFYDCRARAAFVAPERYYNFMQDCLRAKGYETHYTKKPL